MYYAIKHYLIRVSFKNDVLCQACLNKSSGSGENCDNFFFILFKSLNESIILTNLNYLQPKMLVPSLVFYIYLVIMEKLKL